MTFTFTPTDTNELNINHFDSKLFPGDQYTIEHNQVTIHSSEIRSRKEIPGVLILAGNKTYGRHDKNKKLLYRCVPYDKLIPEFLVPYDIKNVGFTKVFVNLYMSFAYTHWTGKHPIGTIGQVIGPVDVLVHFYEYQLLCKGLNTSIQKFQKATAHSLSLRGSPFPLSGKVEQNPLLHLCASNMRMEPLLFADTRHAVPAFRENAPEWAFSKRKGLKKSSKNNESQVATHNEPQVAAHNESQVATDSVAPSELPVASLFAPLFSKVEVDRQNWNIFSIDPHNCVDFDDAFGIRHIGGGVTCISIYISNVTFVLDKLKLWSEFAGRVSTIYLPDKKRPMLPTVLSDDLCSLCAGQVRLALYMDIYLNNEGIGKIEYGNAFIKLRKNFCYEEPSLLLDPDYKTLLGICRWLSSKYKYIDSIDNSHDVVSYLMIFMNYYCAKELLAAKTGIFRASSVTHEVIVPSTIPKEVGKFIKIFNSSRSQYVSYSSDGCIADTQHNMLNMDAYIHITSPIRRIVDLLNMIEFQRVKGLTVLSNDAHSFYSSWMEHIDYINTSSKTIRRVQNDCDLLHLCSNDPDILQNQYQGYLFNKVLLNTGAFLYAVFLPDLNMLSQVIIADGDLEFSSRRFQPFLFKNEENFKRKIRLQPIDI